MLNFREKCVGEIAGRQVGKGQGSTVRPAFDSTVRILPDIGVQGDVLKRGVRNFRFVLYKRLNYQKNSSSIK